MVLNCLCRSRGSDFTYLYFQSCNCPTSFHQHNLEWVRGAWATLWLSEACWSNSDVWQSHRPDLEAAAKPMQVLHSEDGWQGEAGGFLEYQCACPHPGHHLWPQELLTEKNSTPHLGSDHLCWHQPSWASRLHWSKCCTFACVSYKTPSPRIMSLRLAQAPNGFCTDKHHTFVSPVVCWLQGGISQEEQGCQDHNFILDTENLSNLSSEATGTTLQLFASMCHTPHTTSLSRTRHSSPLSPPYFCILGFIIWREGCEGW